MLEHFSYALLVLELLLLQDVRVPQLRLAARAAAIHGAVGTGAVLLQLRVIHHN